MGVKGLTTFINNHDHESLLKSFLLHDCCLVIDGYNLCGTLYRRFHSTAVFGGDYDKFAPHVRTFFNNLRKCNITPYVIFDGSYEHRKLETAYKRLLSRIYLASTLHPVKKDRCDIIPLLLGDVFLEVLDDMEVEYTTCEFEADDEIAAMARHLNCPVLSYDSDFFIYNVLYIPFNTGEFEPISLDDSDKSHAIKCKIFRVEHLTSYFKGLNEELLPLIGILLGNDYVQKQIFQKFFSQLVLPLSNNQNEMLRCIHGLFKWLQNETLDSAIPKILGTLTKAWKSKVLGIIKENITGYCIKECESLKYFNINEEFISPNKQLPDKVEGVKWARLIVEDVGIDDINPEHDNVITNESDKDDYEKDKELKSGLPKFIAKKIRSNHIPKPYINLYTHHLHFCAPQAGDYTDKDYFLCALPILRFAFDIMTDFSHEYCVYVSRKKDNDYEEIYLDREYAISRPLEIPFQDLINDNLKSYFHHFLQQKMDLLDLTRIEKLPSNFQLFMISILWWIKTCEVPVGHVHSLLMCYVMLEVIDERTGTFRGHHDFNSKYSNELKDLRKTQETSEENDELYLDKNKVQYGDCLLAASTLLTHFAWDENIRRNPKSFDVKRIQSFAQFQCCLMQFNCLNTLCGCPFENTKYSKSYNGTFVYNISAKLQNIKNPCQFFEQYLKGATGVLKFYKSLCSIFQKCAEIMNLQMAIKPTTVICSWRRN